MLGPFVRDRIENWASDYCVSDRIAAFAPPLRENAQEVLVTFLTAACDARSVEPQDITEADVRPALEAVAERISLPASCRADTPGLVGDFLAFLEDEGRLAGGRLCGAYARALKPSFTGAAAGKGQTYTNPGSRLGRNDPCPCGSGKKYKKCCMRE